MMCIFQVHLISTNLNPTGERATLRQIELVSVLRSFAPPPVENYMYRHFKFIEVHCGPQQPFEGQDTSGWEGQQRSRGNSSSSLWSICALITFTVYKDSSVRPRKKRYTHLDFRVVQHVKLNIWKFLKYTILWLHIL